MADNEELIRALSAPLSPAPRPRPNPVVDALMGMRERIPENTEHNISLANILRGGLGTAAGWMDWRNKTSPDQYSPQEIMAPLGASIVGKAPAGSLAAGAIRREGKVMPNSEIASLGDLRRILAEQGQGGPFFVRWSVGPDRDMKPGAVSKDYQTGGVHAGLSAEAIDAGMPDEQLFRFLRDYGYLRAPNNPAKPHIYAGQVVGRDSDGADSIRPTRHIGTLSDEFVKQLDDPAYYERLQLTDKVERSRRILAGRSANEGPQSFYDRVARELAENERRLGDLGGALFP